jgi:hypothetical protein
VTGILSLDYLNAGGAISMAGNVLRNRPGGMPLAAAQAATWLSPARRAPTALGAVGASRMPEIGQITNDGGGCADLVSLARHPGSPTTRARNDLPDLPVSLAS